MKIYNSFEYCWILLLFAIPIIVSLGYLYFFQIGEEPIPPIIFVLIEIIFITLIALFYGLRVQLDGKYLSFSFGIGWISKTIDLNEIESARIVKNPWYYGMGIKFIPNGMLYNVHGFHAVELKYKNSNKIVRLGAPDCTELKKAIDLQLEIT